MHVHHTNQALPMQQLVETRQTQAAREAETRRKLSLFLVGDAEEERRSRDTGADEERPRKQKEDEGEFAHLFSVEA